MTTTTPISRTGEELTRGDLAGELAECLRASFDFTKPLTMESMDAWAARARALLARFDAAPTGSERARALEEAARRLDDLAAECTLDLERGEILASAAAVVRALSHPPAEVPRGTPVAAGVTCPKCGGEGRYIVAHGTEFERCDVCGGSGEADPVEADAAREEEWARVATRHAAPIGDDRGMALAEAVKACETVVAGLMASIAHPQTGWSKHNHVQAKKAGATDCIAAIRALAAAQPNPAPPGEAEVDVIAAIKAMPHEQAIGILMQGATEAQWKQLAGMAGTLMCNPEKFIWDPSKAQSTTASATPSPPPPVPGSVTGVKTWPTVLSDAELRSEMEPPAPPALEEAPSLSIERSLADLKTLGDFLKERPRITLMDTVKLVVEAVGLLRALTGNQVVTQDEYRATCRAALELVARYDSQASGKEPRRAPRSTT